MRNDAYLMLLPGVRYKTLADGTRLRILTAMEVLEARREAQKLATREEELALCANACILARAWEMEGKPCFLSAEQLLGTLSVSRIQSMAKVWADFDREENPGLSESQERLESIKKVWSTRIRSAFAGVCSGHLGRSRMKRE